MHASTSTLASLVAKAIAMALVAVAVSVLEVLVVYEDQQGSATGNIISFAVANSIIEGDCDCQR